VKLALAFIFVASLASAAPTLTPTPGPCVNVGNSTFCVSDKVTIDISKASKAFPKMFDGYWGKITQIDSETDEDGNLLFNAHVKLWIEAINGYHEEIFPVEILVHVRA